MVENYNELSTAKLETRRDKNNCREILRLVYNHCQDSKSIKAKVI